MISLDDLRLPNFQTSIWTIPTHLELTSSFRARYIYQLVQLCYISIHLDEGDDVSSTAINSTLFPGVITVISIRVSRGCDSVACRLTRQTTTRTAKSHKTDGFFVVDRSGGVVDYAPVKHPAPSPSPATGESPRVSPTVVSRSLSLLAPFCHRNDTHGGATDKAA